MGIFLRKKTKLAIYFTKTTFKIIINLIFLYIFSHIILNISYNYHINTLQGNFDIYADTKINNNKKLKFGSIKFNKVNMRYGPTTKSAITWVFIKKNEPVKILYQYKDWYKIQDFNNAVGWIHKSKISNERFVIIDHEKQNYINLHIEPNIDSKVIANLENHLRCKIAKKSLKTNKETSWTNIICSKDISGWVQNKHLWGI